MRVTAVFLLLAACAKQDPVEAARDGCKARYDNAQRWIMRHGRAPTTPEEQGDAMRRTEKDPWGNAYRIEQTGADIFVWSLGPDGEPGTADDVSFPPGR